MLVPLVLALALPLRAQGPRDSGYPDFYSMVVSSAAVPGGDRGSVAEGVAWSPEQKLAVVSFMFRGQAGLVGIDLTTGGRRARAALRDLKGMPLRARPGGAAALNGRLWLASGDKVARWTLPALSGGAFNAATQEAIFDVETTGSYVSAGDDGLWVGDFHVRKDLKQSLAAYYPVDVEGRVASAPTRVWDIPNGAHGLALCSGFAALAVTRGPRDHRLELHRPPGERGRLDETTLLRSVSAPPGIVDLECAEDRLLVLFGGKRNASREGVPENRLFALRLEPSR